MALTEAVVMEEVRGHLGGPSEEKLAMTEIQRAMREGLRQLSRHRPIVVEYAFTLVPTVSDYAIPAGVQDVLEEVDQSTLAFNVDPIFFRWADGALLTAMDPLDIRTRDLRAKYLIHPRDVQLLPNDMVRITPVSIDTRPATLLLAMTRTLAQVTPDVQEQYLDYVRGTCLISMAIGRNTRVTRVPTATGVIMFDNGNDLYRYGANLRQAAIAGWGGMATQVAFG